MLIFNSLNTLTNMKYLTGFGAAIIVLFVFLVFEIQLNLEAPKFFQGWTCCTAYNIATFFYEKKTQ